MSSDLLAISTGDDQAVQNADWVEMQALQRDDGSISREDLAHAIKRPGFCTEQRARDLADDVFEELASRRRSLAGLAGWSCDPFRLSPDGDLLEHPKPYRDDGLLYLTLLFMTRHSMDARYRKHAGIDPTVVFEHICLAALCEYFGARTAAFHIGTGGGSRSFSAEINDLCHAVGEGGGWKSDARSPRAGDGGVDLIVWVPFADGKSGKIICFAQCKTGGSWRNGLSTLANPHAFCRKYMRDCTVISPLLPAYLIPCCIASTRWHDDISDANGVLFDRCRIIECSRSVPKSVVRNCRTWINAAIKSGGIGP